MSCCNCCNIRCCGCRPWTVVTLSGVVTGSSGPIRGMVVEYTVERQTHTAITDAAGRYTIQVLKGANVRISLGALVGVTIIPQYYSFTAENDRTDLDFTLTPIGTMFTVSGTITGLSSVSGIAVNYTVNGQAGSTTTDASGNYSFTAIAGSSVVVTPSAQSGYSVTPANYVISMLSSNTSDLDFTYSQVTGTYTISGNMLSPQGAIANRSFIYLVNGRRLTASTDSCGFYSINVPSGSNVVIQPPRIANYSVLPLNLTFSGINRNITGQHFNYTPLSTGI